MKSKEKIIEYKERLKAKFSDYLKSKGMRQTNERFEILEKIIDYNSHFDIESIYTFIEKEYHVSKTTVYSTIDLLCRSNILRKHFLNENQATYDLADSRHLHLICMQCGTVKEVTDSKIYDFMAEQKFRGFTPFFSSTYIHGICSKCKRKKNVNK